MSQSTVDFLYRTIVLTIAGSVAIVLAYLGYVLIFVGDGTRDELVHALSLAIAAAVSSPVILALIHQLVSAVTDRKAPPISLPASVSVPAMSVPVTVPASLSATTNQAPQSQPLAPFTVPPSATPPAASAAGAAGS